MDDAAVPAKSSVSNRRLALGAAVMGGVNIAKVAVQFAMLPIMARLLGPEAYGLYALALPTVTFVLMLADGGLGSSMAREDFGARAVWSSAFWALHGIAVVLAAGVIGWSFVLGAITRQPQLPALMSALSITLLFLASGVLPGARMMRQGRLHVWSIADLTATLAGAGFGIFLAVRGAGTWALVGQYVIGFAIRAVIMNAVAFEMPSFVFDFALLRSHLLLGGSIVGGKLSDYFGRMVENTLISGLLGARMLGIYGFANQAPRFLCESASNPLWATLYVQAVQKPQEAVVGAYYELCRALGIVLFPATILAAVGSAEIIRLFLGPAWHAAAVPLALLLPSFAFAAIGTLNSALLYARGRGGTQLALGSMFTIGRVGAAATGLWVGLAGVAALVALVNVAASIAGAIIPARVLGFSPLTLFRGLVVPFGCAAAAGCLCEILLRLMGERAVTLVVAELLSFSAYLGLLVLLEGRRLRTDIEALRALVRKRPA